MTAIGIVLAKRKTFDEAAGQRAPEIQIGPPARVQETHLRRGERHCTRTITYIAKNNTGVFLDPGPPGVQHG